MKKTRLDVIVLVIFGILVGLWHVLIGSFEKRNSLILYTGLLTIILSVGLLTLWNWMRIVAIAYSIICVAMYVFLVIGTVIGAFQGYGGIGLIFNLPLLILSFTFILFLNLKFFKDKFKQNKE